MIQARRRRPLWTVLAGLAATVLALATTAVQLAVFAACGFAALVVGQLLERALPMIPGIYLASVIVGCLAGWSVSIAVREPLMHLVLLRVMPRLFGDEYLQGDYDCPDGEACPGQRSCRQGERSVAL